MPYNHTYITSAGKVEQIVVTDTNDVNCNLVGSAITNRDGDTVVIDASEQAKLNLNSKQICLFNNPTKAEVFKKAFTVNANDQSNGYIELDSGDYLMPTDEDMECYADIILNRSYFLLSESNPPPRGEYYCDRVSVPNRVYFAPGELRIGMKGLIRIKPKPNV